MRHGINFKFIAPCAQYKFAILMGVPFPRASLVCLIGQLPKSKKLEFSPKIIRTFSKFVRALCGYKHKETSNLPNLIYWIKYCRAM